MTILTMIRATEPEPTPQTRRLYHVTVPASKYDLIKSIADMLVGESYSNEHLDEARERCARIALGAVVEAMMGRVNGLGRRR
jgi:hypothetical protein